MAADATAGNPAVKAKSDAQVEDHLTRLDRQTATLRLVVDSMSEGVVVVDTHGKFRIFNAAARSMLGRGPADLPAAQWADAFGIHLPDRLTLLSVDQLPLMRALKGERLDNFVMFIRGEDQPGGLFISANSRPIESPDGEIVGAVAVFRNVSDQRRTEEELRDAREELERRVVERTLSLARANRELNIEIEERKQAESALRASERQFKLIADSLPVIIAYVDARQRYIFQNTAYRSWFGHEDGHILGRPVWEVVGIERYKVLRPFIEQALTGRPVVTSIEVTHHELGARHVQMNLVPDRDEHGSIQGFYLVGIDITERLEIEALERQHREELAHVSRVTTMGELTAALAHELNQPLTSIRSNAQAALKLIGANEIGTAEIEEILADIIADDRRASEVIRRLRAMLKKRPMTLETLTLSDVIEETRSLVSGDAVRRGVVLDVVLGPTLPAVRADRIQLQQVLLNLIMNGFEAMRDKTGEKVVRIQSLRPCDEEVCVCVSDSGSGLPRLADANAVFRPFFSTKEEGMGMGLSISRSIIEGMGGRIWAVNNAGGGATFHFTIPVAT